MATGISPDTGMLRRYRASKSGRKHLQCSGLWGSLNGWISSRPVVPIAVLLLIGNYAPSQTLPPIDLPAGRISVNVDMVVLHATVHDRKGHFVSDLKQRDFDIYEDNVRQEVRLFLHEDIPVTVGLVVDHSGSMRQKLADVIAAARTFVRSSHPLDEMFVINFNERVSMGLPPAIPFTNRIEQLEAAILKAPTTGQTALYDAVASGLERLQSARCDKKVLVVISDGSDNASARSMAQLLKLAGQSSALIYTIGIFEENSRDRNPGVLKRLARSSGGEAYFPSELSEVVAICETIARDIRHQYTLGYISTSAAQPGAYRKIHVLGGPPGSARLTLRTRSGYVAGGASDR